MNAEQESQAEENTSTIDSIALEAIGSATDSGYEPSAHSDQSVALPSLSHAQSFGLNLDHGDGEPINEYCNSRRLDITALLKLFKQVCDAVHFAHQRGIIHRNLKPGNIVITSDGVPKLIHCGIAHAAHCGSENNRDPDRLVNLTQPEELAMTPAYMSPEQVTGETITTASDIYSLGVILYELLTGRQPYHLKTGDTSEILQAICEQASERPSQVAAAQVSLPGQLKQKLTGDLDSIVLMAMRKEPERRFRSADHFALDLERYLGGLSVCAHRGSTAYQAYKFLRRHPVATLTTAALLSVFVGVAVVGVSALLKARQARARAEDSSRLGRETINNVFTRVSQERLLNQPRLHEIRNALLEDAHRFYEEFLRQHRGDRALLAELALARTRIAEISSVTGSATEAIGQFQQAVDLWEELVSTQPANAAYREELARALNEQGQAMMRLKGRTAEALRRFHRALDLIEPHVAATPSTAASRELSMILLNLGMAQKEEGQSEEAIKSIERSLTIETQLALVNPDSLDPPIAMAKVHTLLGQLFLEEPEGSEPALAEYQQAIGLLEKVTRQHPELPDQAVEMAILLGDLNRIQQMAGKLDSALASAGKAVEILERLNRQYPDVLDYEQTLADIYQTTSNLHHQRREPAQALGLAQKSQALLDGAVKRHPENAGLRLDLAKSQSILGRMLQQTGEPVDAMRSYQRAIDIYESMPERDPRGKYLLAGNIALTIRLIGVRNGSGDTIDISKLSKTDLLRRERYGSRAVELLGEAARDGALDFDALQSDTDLDPLRDRADFQALVNEVREKTSDPKK